MRQKTLSFVKGKGSLTHNNRSFIADNVDPGRVEDNVIYVRQSLEEAYETCFGDAIREYNAKQKRKDRQKHDYINEIKNSGNNEKVFYENVVMIGNMTDTAVLDPEGNPSEEGAIAAEILDEYVRSFQERNPNLYLFNAVLHMDEATPHLHLDYIPVASGCYKTGLKTRNSLSKALQCMGFEKGKGRYTNETTAWQEREREYLTALCREREIEIISTEEHRADLSLPEYKAVMREIDEMKEESEELREQNSKLQKEEAALSKKIQQEKSIRENHHASIRPFLEEAKWQLPQPGLESGKHYRQEKALPLVKKLKGVINDLIYKCQNLKEKLKEKDREIEWYASKLQGAERRLEAQTEELGTLRTMAHDVSLFEQYYGVERFENTIQVLLQKEKEELEMKKLLKKKSIMKNRGAR